MGKGHMIIWEGEEREAAADEVAEGILKGGSGSGNFGHAGRPGQVGGSAEGTGSNAKRTTTAWRGTEVVLPGGERGRILNRNKYGYWVTNMDKPITEPQSELYSRETLTSINDNLAEMEHTAGLTGKIAKPLFNAKKMTVTEAAWHKRFVSETLRNMTEHPEEFDRKPANDFEPKLRDLVVQGLWEHAQSADSHGHPKLTAAFRATASVIQYGKPTDDEAARKALAIMNQQFETYLSTKKRRY